LLTADGWLGKMAAEIFLIKTADRFEAVRSLLKCFDMEEFKGKTVALKANFNSADPFPASTHLETLGALVLGLKEAGAKDIEMAERSGMGNTRAVLERTGVFQLANQLGFKVSVLDEVGEEGWIRVQSEKFHWKRGFLVAKVFHEADMVVQTCCLKTHRFGGHFTMALKNSVGLIAKFDPVDGYNYMNELHTSKHQRLMIAEINQAYKTDLIVMDGLESFVSEGPESGETASPGVMLAGQDRVAMDAVGVAILRFFGTTLEVSSGKIFEQEQITRACELGMGARSTQEIKLVPIDEETKKLIEKIEPILKEG